MVWTKEQAAVQALMRGRAALADFAADIGRVIDVLTPGGAAEAVCPGCDCQCHHGAIAAEACICRTRQVGGVLQGLITIPRETFAEAVAAWCACNCPTQVTGQPGTHRGECVEMRSLLYPVGGNLPSLRETRRDAQ